MDAKQAPATLALAPLGPLGFGMKLWLGFVLAGVGLLIYSFLHVLLVGHIALGGGTYGAVWGIMVANIIHLIGISHVGIAISAVVRIMALERYKQLARLAEFVTLASLITAVVNIGLDVGRPDRFIINVFWYGRWHSPFVWSMTVITTYLAGSTIYLYLAMRADLAACAALVPGRAPFFRLISLGYVDTDEARARHRRVVWWLAVIILPIMVSVHSVYGYIFGLQAARPGWYNPVMAPYFVLGAVVSGFSAMIVVAAVIRRAFGWQQFLPDRIFKGLGIVLGFVTLLYMYFFFSEVLTAQYASPIKEFAVSNEVLNGRFAPIFWPTFIAGLFIPFWALFVQGANPRICSVPLTVTSAVLINVAMWIKRGLIVVPSFYHPMLSHYRIAEYIPTPLEVLQVLSSDAVGALIFTGLLLILPSLELDHVPGLERAAAAAIPPGRWALSPLRRPVLYLSIITGVALIFLGIAVREYYPAAPIWILGILVLFTIPLQLCLPQSLATIPEPGAELLPAWQEQPSRSRPAG